MLAALAVLQQQVGSGACTVGKEKVTQEAPLLPAKAGGLEAGVGDILRSFVRVAKEVAQADEMAAQLEASAPADAEAARWHGIAVTSLAWSRAALVQQQDSLLKQLGVLARTPPPGLGVEKLADGPPAAGELHGEHNELVVDGLSDGEEKQLAFLPSAVRRRWTQESAKEVVGSLSCDLLRLQNYSARRCILVRKIKPLGLEQPQRLKEYFERFGSVTEVLCAHSYEKPSKKRRHGRVRPAALGFVVMDEDVVADRILEANETHVVKAGPITCEVTVQAYDPHAKGADGCPMILEA